MKKYLVVFLAAAVLSSTFAAAADKVDYKKCYKLCMKEIDDHDKCDLMCDDNKNDKR